MDLFHFKIGACFALLIWVIIEFVAIERTDRLLWKDPFFSLLLCLGDFLILLFMWGVSVDVWIRQGINFEKLLLNFIGFPYTGKPPTSREIFVEAVDLSVLFLLTVSLYMSEVRGRRYTSLGLNTEQGQLVRGTLHSYYIFIPIGFAAYFIYRLVLPVYRRKPYFYALYQTLAAPKFCVHFVDSYVGDILTSLVRVIIPLTSITVLLCTQLFAAMFSFVGYKMYSFQVVYDAIITKSWYLHGIIPLVSLLPLWLRLMQCLRRAVNSGNRWPHFANGLKYTSAFFVISLGIFQSHVRHTWWWVLLFVGATLFQFYWDIAMDWGILYITVQSSAEAGYSAVQSSPTDHPYEVIYRIDFGLFHVSVWRRTQLLLHPTWLYYTVIAVSNLILRFSWTLLLLPNGVAEVKVFVENHTLVELLFIYITPVLAAVEIVRRMVWGIVRVEFEHFVVFGTERYYDSHDSGSDDNLVAEDLNKENIDTDDIEEASTSVISEDVRFTSMSIDQNVSSHRHSHSSSSQVALASVIEETVDMACLQCAMYCSEPEDSQYPEPQFSSGFPKDVSPERLREAIFFGIAVFGLLILTTCPIFE